MELTTYQMRRLIVKDPFNLTLRLSVERPHAGPGDAPAPRLDLSAFGQFSASVLSCAAKTTVAAPGDAHGFWKASRCC